MMSQEQNDLITRTGPKDPCGKLMRSYWQPAALVDELEGARPIRPVKLLGENLVLFRDEQRPLRPDRSPLRASRRRPRLRPARAWRPALRLPWLAVRRHRPVPGDAGRADGFKALPEHPQRSYPVVEKSGILWAYLGEGEPPAFPEIDCFVAPDSHTFAFKGHMACNWLQALEVGIDPAHASYPASLLRGRGHVRPPTASSSAAPPPAPTCR